MVFLQTERLTIDLVKDWKVQLQTFEAALHVSDTRVYFLRILILEVLFDARLLHALLIVEIVGEVISHCLQSLLFLFCLPLINTMPLNISKHGYVDLCSRFLPGLSPCISFFHHLIDLLLNAQRLSAFLNLVLHDASKVEAHTMSASLSLNREDVSDV